MGVRQTQNSLLGKGLAFPLRMDPTTNDFGKVVDEDNVDTCLRALIFTMIGERMNPLLGTIVPELVFEDTGIAADIAQPSIAQAINKMEPRVSLKRINVVERQWPSGVSGILIEVAYVIRATNQKRNKVFPYAIPGGS